MNKATKIEALDGLDIYETPSGKFYAIVRFGKCKGKSKEFDTLLDLTNYYNIQ